ncbi:hypothetical protein [Roseibium sp.]|uniref:phage adaptor protein n=1 Tax=Roseibium sp. TaxID=1936156 RepID=UPI003B517A10
MNYLQLCRRTAHESGTSSFPGTVSGLNGRPLDIANWVQQAWIDIQNDRAEWLWLEDRFEGTLLAGISTYEASDFGLTRFREWKPGKDPETGIANFTVQGANEDRAQEAPIYDMTWGRFWRTYDRGANAGRTEKPLVYTVDTQERLRFWPVPDGSYTVRGLCRRSAQRLTASDDVPEVHEDHHMIIVWKALLLLAAHDESIDQPQFWHTNYTNMLGDLQRVELPRIKVAGPLV